MNQQIITTNPKDDFFSLAVHELKTPIVAMLGYMDLIRLKFSESDKQKFGGEFEILTGLTKELSDLVNDLLVVSRIDQGRITINWVMADVNQIILEVLGELQPAATTKDLKLIYSEAELPQIKSDPEKLRQILINLIGNSIKYTLQGGVEVKVWSDQDQLVIEIKDTGIGIPLEELPKIFNKFNRIWDEKTKDVRGSGLGLWITKEIIGLIGGEIIAESVYGTGTKMTVKLPLNH